MSVFFKNSIAKLKSRLSRKSEKATSEPSPDSELHAQRQQLSEKPDKEAQERARNRYYTKISAYLFYILMFLVCYEAAAFFLYKIPAKSSALAGLSSQELKTLRDQTKTVNVTTIPLFGNEVREAPVSAQQSNPQEGRISNLDIKITGISASSDPTKGSVALIYKNDEDTYGVGEKLNKTNVTITKILPDKIIINNGGKEETVKMPADVFTPQVFADDDTKTASNANKEEVKQVRTELLSNPGNLFKYLSIKPAMKDGKPIGYELNPGTESKLFINSGLKPGDIAVEMNGYDLTDTTQAMQVMGQLQDMTEVTLVVDRNGDRQTINLDLK